MAGLAWAASPQLQATTDKFTQDYQIYKELNQPTSVGLRLEFWEKSLRFFAEAPIIGHGTGSTRGLFEAAATGPAVLAPGAGDRQSAQPDAQCRGAVGHRSGSSSCTRCGSSHLLLFRGEGLAAWIGLMVVLQNIFTSLFNSHLFDFHEGWMYVLGVGVAGGMVLQAQSPRRGREPFRNRPVMIAGMHAADEISAGAGMPCESPYRFRSRPLE